MASLSVFIPLSPGAQRLSLLLLRSAQRLCVSARDDEGAAVKNEEGGSDLSTLGSTRGGVVAEGGEATQKATLKVFLCEAKMDEMGEVVSVSPPLHRTERREDGLGGEGKERRQVDFLATRRPYMS